MFLIDQIFCFWLIGWLGLLSVTAGRCRMGGWGAVRWKRETILRMILGMILRTFVRSVTDTRSLWGACRVVPSFFFFYLFLSYDTGLVL